MGYNSSECAHRWVHNQRMKSDDSRFYESSNMHFDERSCLSYRTTICQCLDRDKHLFLMIDQHLTNETAKHLGHLRHAIPSDWHVIETHWDARNSSYYYYHSYNNVAFLGSRDSFNKEKRMWLVNHFLMDLYWDFQYVTTGKTKETPNINLYPLKAIGILNSLYRDDCSLKKWLRTPYEKLPGTSEFTEEGVDRREVYKRVRTMVSLILEFHIEVNIACEKYYGHWDVNFTTDEENWKQKISDAMFGEGTWESMEKRISGIGKAQATIAKMDAIREYLSLPATNENAFQKKNENELTNKGLRKMLKSHDGRLELLQMKKDRLAVITTNKEQSDRIKRQRESYNRARMFMGINVLSDTDLRWGSNFGVKSIKVDEKTIYLSDYPKSWIRADYNLSESVWPHYVSAYFNRDNVEFTGSEYDKFCQARDKKLYRKRFWQKAELCMRRKRGHKLYEFYATLNGNMSLTPEDHHIMNEFVVRKDRWDADRERRERVEFERKRKEYQAKLEKLEAYKNGGIEGVRRIWREHLGSIPAEIALSKSELFYGGNVLLRFGSQNGIIETSKGIRMTFAECHEYWNIINGWHNGQPFVPVTMAGYSVEYYKEDILKAGCHEIAYCEMERMYAAMCEKEAA